MALFGVLNVTPDSFSDGGRYLAPEAALARARALRTEGADVVDVGAESTRPRGAAYGEGYRTLSADEEWVRLAPVVAPLVAGGVSVSVDTSKGTVAARALEAGASFVNDTQNGADASLLAAVAAHRAGLVLMHNRGRGEIEGDNVRYGDVVADVIGELSAATDRALAAGVPDACIAWDPGLGFAKTAEQSLVLLRGLPRLVEIGYPVMVGASRKSFLAARPLRVAERPGPESRLGASVAACLLAAQAGASMIRVHDVHDSAIALDLWESMR